MSDDSSQVVYGIHPVLAVLEDPEQGKRVQEVFAQEGLSSRPILKALELAKGLGVKTRRRPSANLTRAAEGGRHQGLVMILGPFPYSTLEEVLAGVKGKPHARLLILDGVQDPRNVGALLRSAAAFGIQGVILPKDRSAPINADAIKSSAGAAFKLPIARVTNLSRTLDALKKEDIWIYGADLKGRVRPDQASWDMRIAIVMGSEGKGMRRLTREKCDVLLKIPHEANSIESLNVSVAGGILMYTAHNALLALMLVALVASLGCNRTEMPQSMTPEERRAARGRITRTATAPPLTLPATTTPKPLVNDSKQSTHTNTQPASLPPKGNAPVAATPTDLVLGVYKLDTSKGSAILDGDTIRVVGLDATLRLLGIDTEESFKKDKDRNASDADFKAYAIAKRGDKKHPAKFSTPMGEEATRWAREWFQGHDEVRLEFDDLGRIRGVYNRYLVFVFAKKNGQWVNYNVESVRAGMTPYFSKYGYSLRFHDELVAAQEEAQAAKVGIWGNNGIEGYTDYPERIDWWERRAKALQNFQDSYAGSPDIAELGNAQDWTKLQGMEGKTVTVFGSLDRKSRLNKGAPFLRYMSNTRKASFGLVSPTLAALDALKLDRFEGEFFYARGVITLYKGNPQFKVENIEKVWAE